MTKLSQAALSAVVAYARKSRAIGLYSALPWPRLPTDLARFKALTEHAPIIMGRRTFESAEIDSVPFRCRRNIVLSRDAGWPSPAGVMHADDWNEALLLAEAGFGGAGYDDGETVTSAHPFRKNVFVIGGEAVYRHALTLSDPLCSTIFATEIEGDWDGDTFFPEIDQTEWVRFGAEHEHNDTHEQHLVLPAANCPQGWALPESVTENGITFRFVTYQRRDYLMRRFSTI